MARGEAVLLIRFHENKINALLATIDSKVRHIANVLYTFLNSQ